MKDREELLLTPEELDKPQYWYDKYHGVRDTEAICKAQLTKALPVREEIERQEREKYNEAILLVVDVAGLKQNIFTDQDILGLVERAEEIITTLKGESNEIS